MVHEYWNRLNTPLKMIFGVCGALVLVILVHGTYTYRVNHQKAFAYAVGKRIGIETIRVSAKSDVLILEGSATRQQSDYAERISQDYIMRYGPRSVNPPTEIRNSLQIRETQVRPIKQVRFIPAKARHHGLATAKAQSTKVISQAAVRSRVRQLQRQPKQVQAAAVQRHFRYNDVVNSRRLIASAGKRSGTLSR